MTTQTPMAPRADACPEPEQLAAYIDGTLPPDERTLLERHLVGCAECRDIIGESARALQEIPSLHAAKPTPWKWLGVAGGLVAAAAALLLMVRVNRVDVDWTPLLPQASAARPFDARVSVMTNYAPAPSVTRGGSPREVSVDARLAAAQIEKMAVEHRTGETLHHAGTARLLVGDPSGAIDKLRQAADATPTAAVLSDLAAALLVDAVQRNDAAQLENARESANRALSLDAAYRPALFNEALIEERAASPTAAAAWQRYLQVDSASGWGDEARIHLARLRPPPR